MNRQPNIVMIMVDEMRGDAMGIAGHPDVKTPHLDTVVGKRMLVPASAVFCTAIVCPRAKACSSL